MTQPTIEEVRAVKVAECLQKLRCRKTGSCVPCDNCFELEESMKDE